MFTENYFDLSANLQCCVLYDYLEKVRQAKFYEMSINQCQRVFYILHYVIATSLQVFKVLRYKANIAMED